LLTAYPVRPRWRACCGSLQKGLEGWRKGDSSFKMETKGAFKKEKKENGSSHIGEGELTWTGRCR